MRRCLRCHLSVPWCLSDCLGMETQACIVSSMLTIARCFADPCTATNVGSRACCLAGLAHAGALQEAVSRRPADSAGSGPAETERLRAQLAQRSSEVAGALATAHALCRRLAAASMPLTPPYNPASAAAATSASASATWRLGVAGTAAGTDLLAGAMNSEDLGAVMQVLSGQVSELLSTLKYARLHQPQTLLAGPGVGTGMGGRAVGSAAAGHADSPAGGLVDDRATATLPGSSLGGGSGGGGGGGGASNGDGGGDGGVASWARVQRLTELLQGSVTALDVACGRLEAAMQGAGAGAPSAPPNWQGQEAGSARGGMAGAEVWCSAGTSGPGAAGLVPEIRGPTATVVSEVMAVGATLGLLALEVQRGAAAAAAAAERAASGDTLMRLAGGEEGARGGGAAGGGGFSFPIIPQTGPGVEATPAPTQRPAAALAAGVAGGTAGYLAAGGGTVPPTSSSWHTATPPTELLRRAGIAPGPAAAAGAGGGGGDGGVGVGGGREGAWGSLDARQGGVTEGGSYEESCGAAHQRAQAQAQARMQAEYALAQTTRAQIVQAQVLQAQVQAAQAQAQLEQAQEVQAQAKEVQAQAQVQAQRHATQAQSQAAQAALLTDRLLEQRQRADKWKERCRTLSQQLAAVRAAAAAREAAAGERERHAEAALEDSLARSQAEVLR